MAGHQSRVFSHGIPWGWRNMPISQLRENQQYSSVNVRVTGLAQHSGGFHSKTTNALCLLCFVLCTCRGHKSSAMGIQLWRGIEVGSPVAPWHRVPCALPLGLDRSMWKEPLFHLDVIDGHTLVSRVRHHDRHIMQSSGAIVRVLRGDAMEQGVKKFMRHRGDEFHRPCR